MTNFFRFQLYFWLSLGVLSLLSWLHLEWPHTFAEVSSEWEMVALCESHSELTSPQNMNARFAYSSLATGMQVNATLSFDGGEEIQSGVHRFSFPEKGWVSILFDGPSLRNQIFCEDANGPKFFSMNYEKGDAVRLSAGSQNRFSEKELPNSDSPPEPVMPLLPQGEDQNIYEAGHNTAQPYWLQISVPVHSNHNLHTALRYSIQ